MAITVKHKFVSAIPDGTDDTIVRPSNWNDDHELTGTIPVANGGTGASTLTGYVKGNGTAAMTASATVPSTDITGLGTMSTQNSNSVSITGGSISGTTVSGYVPTTTTITAGTGLTGGGDLSANRTLSISNTTVTAAAYGSASKTLTATVNAQGQLTALADTNIAITNTQVSGLGTASTRDAGVALGVATLDAAGKVPVTELPDAVLGALSYQGTWDASTNTPTLTSSVGTKGYYYVVSVAGTTNLNGITDWLVGDWAVYNGTAWQKVDNTDSVTSVNGFTGAVSLTTTNINEGTNQYFTTARARASVSAGTGISYNSTTGVITNSSPSLGGDVVGPSSATNNAIARFDTTTGKLIQNSLVIIGDTGSVTGVNALTAESLTVNNNATLGSSNTDTLEVNARITTDLEPNTDAAKDIGTSGRNWRDGFFSRNLQAEGKVVSPHFDALNSAGGQLRNSSGTPQLQWGGGGGNNVSVDVAININPANAQVDLSPTGTGTVRIAPATAGTMNNMVIGGTTPLAGSFTDLSVTGTTSFDGSQGTAGQVLTSAGTGATPTWTTPTTGTVTSVDATAGTGISVSGGPITTSGSLTITNTAPDQVVGLTGAGTTSISGTYPNFTITSDDQFDGTVTSVDLTAGTGISVSGGPITSSGSITVTNTAPDQVVSLTGAGTTSISGTYPNFTITSNDSTVGTVTSVSGTGTVNGISLSGTVTSSGNLTLGGTLSNVSLATQVTGTLPIANGGTGETTRQAAIDALAGAVTSGQYLRGNGTDVVMSAIQAADVPTLNQNTTGTAANVTGTVAIANGGTGQTTANAAYNALSPMTTTGDITYEATGGIATRLPIGTAGQVLTVASGLPSWAAAGGGSNLVKAWVNFNGTGTPAIRGSFNVSSITDNSTGNYTINFTNALDDANYSFAGGCNNDGSGWGEVTAVTGGTYSTTACNIRTVGYLAFFDPSIVCCNFFR